MADAEKALATMVRNIEAKTGKTVKQIAKTIAESGLTKHGEIRTMVMETYGLGYGAANTITHLARKPNEQSGAQAKGLSTDQVLAGMYIHKKEHLRPVHDRILEILRGLGDFEAAPKKGYVSYRLKKQFAMVGPKTNSQVEVGLSAKQLPADPRLKEMPAGSMCRYTTRLSSPDEVDADLEGWIRASYTEAG